MRIVAIVICLAALIGIAWHSVMRGTDQQKMYGAPQIRELVDADVRDAVLPIATHPIEIRTDGRNVRLSGPVNSEAERQAIVQAAQSTRLLGSLDDDLRVLPKASPYLFHAILDKDGSIVLSGHVPNAKVHEALIAEARAQAENAVVADRLVMAAGVPDGDWAGMVRSGLSALSELREGQVQISDTLAIVSGAANDVEAAQRMMQTVNSAPLGEWQVQITGALPVAEVYDFSAMRMDDGSIIVDGNAPDEETRKAFLDAAGAISSKPVAGTINLSDGMPSPSWPDSITAGIAALGSTSSGFLKVDNSTVSLTAEVGGDDDLARLLPLLRDDWITDITVQNPTPEARLEIALGADGALSATGLLPEGMDPATLTTTLPDLAQDGIDPATRGRPAEWGPALEGLQIVLPRFQTATALLTGKTVAVTGKLKRGFSADGARAALKSVLDRDWNLDLNITESAPLAELILSKRDGEIAVSGLLPFGLNAEDALGLLGEGAGGEGLSGGGDGDPLAWTEALTATRLALARFADATGAVSEGQVDLTGRLLPGYPAPAMQAWLSERLPDGWTTGLSADEIEPSEGDQRTSLTTGEAQNFRQGYWLPNVEFEVSTAQCQQQMDAALQSDNIAFVTGSARIDQKGATLLNRLAAVAVRCLNSSGIILEIGGHTDSVGNDENNLQLSQERADAVRDALLRRGVREDAVLSTGYGENEPIATNDTAEGRAQNRRIAFGWSERTN